MKEATDFYYDGIHSVDMGLINCEIDTGLYEEPFVAEKEIHEISIRGRDKPYFQGVKRLPLSFSLTFAFTDYFDTELIRKAARWLDQDNYRPFYTTSNPERIFYCMTNGESNLFHNGNKQGYFTIQMRCSDSYTYSPIYNKNYNWQESPKRIEVNSFSNGNSDHAVTNSDGSLSLPENKTRWGNLSPLITWNDV